MKQGKTEKAVFAKLSAEKVELGSVQEVEKLINKTKSDTKVLKGLISSIGDDLGGELRMAAKVYQARWVDANNALDSIEKAFSQNAQAVDTLDYTLSDLERNAKEIGINPNEMNVVKESLNTINDFATAYDSLRKIKTGLDSALSSFKDPR